MSRPQGRGQPTARARSLLKDATSSGAEKWIALFGKGSERTVLRTAVEAPVPLLPTTRAYRSATSCPRAQESAARLAMSAGRGTVALSSPWFRTRRPTAARAPTALAARAPTATHAHRQPRTPRTWLRARRRRLAQKEGARDDEETEDKHEPLNDIRQQIPDVGVCEDRDMRRRGGGGGGCGGRVMARRQKIRCGGRPTCEASLWIYFFCRLTHTHGEKSFQEAVQCE